MYQPDYTSEVKPLTKWISVLLLSIAFFVSTLCLLVGTVVLLIGKDVPLGALWGSIAIFSFISFCSGWLLIRLIQDAKAKNETTTMPELFIQVFGVMFIVGVIITAVSTKNFLLLPEALAIGFAMVKIRSLLTKKSNEESMQRSATQDKLIDNI